MNYATLFTRRIAGLFGGKRPLLGGIKLTHNCNLSCVHCPFRKREAPSLSFPQAVASLKALHQRGVRILIIEGGEPFLWKDGAFTLHDVEREAKALFHSVGIATNGTFPIESGADIVWVSVDGMKTTHDKIRGESFDRILANCKASSHPNIYAHITINSMNGDEIPELVKFLSDKVKGITIQFHYPYDGVDDSLMLSPDRRQSVLDALIDLKAQGFPLADSAVCLKALKTNRWTCRPWLIASVDPDGRLTHGCYVKNRGEIACKQCGFAAHAEISLAYNGAPGAILAGRKMFG